MSELNIEIFDEIAEGIYCNVVMITHSETEFILDFINNFSISDIKKARVKSRIILTPKHAQQFLASFVDNIEKYENTMGNIKKNNPAYKK